MPFLVAAVHHAVAHWNDDEGHRHAYLTKTTRGMYINDLWIADAEQALHDDAGVQVIRNKERRCLVVDDAFLFRFKHVSTSYKPRNHSTQRAAAWDGQVPFKTIHPLPRLDFVYRMDETGSVVLDIAVILFLNGNSVWRWPVLNYPQTEFGVPKMDMFGDDVLTHSKVAGGRP